MLRRKRRRYIVESSSSELDDDETDGPCVRVLVPETSKKKQMRGTVTAWYPENSNSGLYGDGYGYVQRKLRSEGCRYDEVEHLRFEADALPAKMKEEFDRGAWRQRPVMFKFQGRNPQGGWQCEDLIEGHSTNDADGNTFEARRCSEIYDDCIGIWEQENAQYTQNELRRMGLGQVCMFNLMLCWAIYRQCVLLNRRNPDKKTARALFDDILLSLPEAKADALRGIMQLRVTCTGCRDNRTLLLEQTFQKTSFTNVFHHDDAHNELLALLWGCLDKDAFVVVVTLAYYTGGRSFVKALAEHIQGMDAHARQTIARNPERFLRRSVRLCYGKFTWSDVEYPSLFHRRYRPMSLEDNRVRGCYADHFQEVDVSTDMVKKQLIDHGSEFVLEHVMPVATNAEEVVASACDYESLYLTLVGFLPKTDEREFHAKNIANTLELHLCPGNDILDRQVESESNGLGPGFRSMAHIRQGFGKVTRRLTKEQLEAELQDAHNYVKPLWPWPFVPLRRHVQSWYCELQKLLFCFRNGHPALPSQRHPAPLNRKSVEQLGKGKAKGSKLAKAKGRIQKRQASQAAEEEGI